MAAINVISAALQITTPTGQKENDMQIDIPDSGHNKRKKQSSSELMTLLTEETQESIMTQPTEAETQENGVHNAGGQ